MPREVWGTYSVIDHKAPRAFIADVMLYDRLVLPVPEEGEWHLWEENDWAPDRQAALREILEKQGRVKCRPWKVGQWQDDQVDYQKRMAERYAFDEALAEQIGQDAFLYTRDKLVEELPRSVTGLHAVPTYRSAEEFKKSVGYEDAQDREKPIMLPIGGLAAASIGAKFLVPEDPAADDEDLLGEAIEISTGATYRKARRSFWRWQREFYGDDVITDQETLDAAAEEMADLLADVERAYAWDRAKTIGRYAFLVGSIALGMIGGPLTVVSIAGVTLSVGEFSFNQIAEAQDKRDPAPAALVHTAKKEFA